MRCPCCGKDVELSHFACQSGKSGGKGGSGKAKARTSEQARKAALVRWAKDRKEE